MWECACGPALLQRTYSDLRLRSAAGAVDLSVVDACFGAFLPPALLGRLMASWDRARVGQVDVAELTACVSVCCKGSIDERIAYAFKLFDADKTGRLTAAQVCPLPRGEGWAPERRRRHAGPCHGDGHRCAAPPLQWLAPALLQVSEMVGIVWWTSQKPNTAESGYNPASLEALVCAVPRAFAPASMHGCAAPTVPVLHTSSLKVTCLLVPAPPTRPAEGSSSRAAAHLEGAGP
jgi:hypothetical protein